MKLLHIDSSILGAGSASRRLTSLIVEAETARHPGLEVVRRDLGSAPVSHLTGEHLAALHGAVPESASVRDDVAAGEAVLQEFLAADIVVVGAPMYNFSVPSQLKAWIDRIAVAGRTFQYSEKGPVGLAGGKVVIVASTRGGFYGPGTAMAALDHQESYLRSVFGFLGITDIRFVRAEGVALGEEQRARSMDDAARAIEGLAA
ncbi:FMN-dependent NADH-azoreductase [uncultured Alsobacter sp.]|uniref:FMN-dependent NADH-azoreductase n=1 Tax=uncultured Alsobacter sp. TaxID=1748258 RepID=UPI0025EEEDAA|nr:FMN-dependent NADH-azoreductase [uncultured Alsobacter sp.]